MFSKCRSLLIHRFALAADIRIVAPDARLSVMEIKWGLIPDMSGTQTLRRLVRLDVAKELTFSAQDGIPSVLRLRRFAEQFMGTGP